MSYFTKDFFNFFRELSENNNRDWFNENKSRYKKTVEKPFYHFVEEMILRIRDDDPEILISPKEAIFRVYKDVRFSKDKSPYKTHASAIISPGGRKDFIMAGFYIEINHKELNLYGGLYSVGSKELNNLRRYITANLKKFQKIKNEKSFTERFGEILGETNKRIPKEFDEALIKEPLLANKQFYFYHKFGKKEVMQDDLTDKLIEYYGASRPLIKFLREGVVFDNDRN